MNIIIKGKPELKENPRMVMGFNGWVDVGFVSSGTVISLRDKLNAERIGEMNCQELYVYNMPRIMPGIQSRPYVDIKNGMLRKLVYPTNTIHYSNKENLILFLGKEPNITPWKYVSLFFELVEKLRVREIYFVGGVSAPVPHTRKPKVSASFSSEELGEKLRDYVEITDYKGEASIVSHLLQNATKTRRRMANLFFEMPLYLFPLEIGFYPKGLHAAISLLNNILGINVDLSELNRQSLGLQEILDERVQMNPGLSEMVNEWEEKYDAGIVPDEDVDIEQFKRLMNGLDIDK